MKLQFIFKIILIILNLVALFFAVIWFLKTREYEPIIVIISQISTLIGIVASISSIDIGNVKNESEISIIDEVQTGEIKIIDIDNSKIDIKKLEK